MIRRLILVAFFIEVGLLLAVLPWSAFWDHNYFLLTWPQLRPVLTNNFLRGAISGVGVVNLWAGFSDLGAVFSMRREPPAPDADRRYP